jgi:hypothetical protein
MFAALFHNIDLSFTFRSIYLFKSIKYHDI